VHQQLVDIAREAVRNAIQHAKCRCVQVTVEYDSRSIVLIIADDGCGMAPIPAQKHRAAGHYGILGMRERARQLTAAFSLGPNGSSGTRIAVRVGAEIAFEDGSGSAWSRLMGHWWS
jgi:signal transduction histidine kinase